MSDIKVLAICGSPRKGGNTDALLRKFLDGARTEGAVGEIIYITDLSITPCTECSSCFQSGRCIISDDMQNVYPLLLESDIIVFASPVFFCGVTGWAKALIDRAQALWAKKYILHDPSFGREGKQRQGFFISVGGTKGQKMFEGAVMTVKYFFDALNASYAGELLIREVDACGDVLRLPDALRDAFSAGKKIVAEFREEIS